MPPQRSALRGIFIIAAMFGFGLVGTAVIDAMGWDLAWTARYYVPGGANDGWAYAREFPWNALYDYGEYPGVALLVGAMVLYIGALIGRAPRQYAKPCLVVILTIALGPGLLVNGILKEYWGRPRPAEITAFGGNKEFRQVWKPGGPGEGKSFTCGHCAMAISLSSVAAFYPLHPAVSVCALVGGIIYGIVMGIARMIQGGHFPTDVLWSGVLVLSLIALLYYVVLRVPETEAGSRKPSP
ncbi:MAG: phosphatase PAP2 family protein [Desulfomonile tiedjei]|nr:phosphatase PAP2 family protein [Desulfomonile tiedjei]